MTLVKNFIEYLRDERQYSPLTLTAYESDLTQWADYATDGNIDDLQPMDVTTSDLRTWIAHLSASGVSARSVKRKASALCSFFRFLMKRHGLAANPAADLVLARVKKKLPDVIPQQQTQQILDEDYDHEDFCQTRDHLILDMFYQTGIRVSELIGLLDRNVNTAAGSIKVLGKRRKERIVPIGPLLVAEINEYRRLRVSVMEKHSSVCDCFFVTNHASQMTYGNVRTIVHRALDGKVTSAKRSPHALRHSFATDMLNNGADLNTVKELLGHQSLETTQIYTHISFSELKNNYQLAHPRAQKKG